MKTSNSYRMFQLINGILMVLIVIATLYPFLFLVAQSFSSEAAVHGGKITIFPVGFTTETYRVI
ncbi:MAG: carbohydrate ABC transporter permease, partial [Gorillibacterium sp.]|nr:carbohydrate ABC transporter permease [Gorillibacterium sp.]